MPVKLWWWALPLAVITLTGVFLLRTYDPNAVDNPFPSCLFHTVTGMYCPGCGLTRALHALVHLDLLRAIRMNAFFIFSAPIFALLIWRLLKPLPGMLEQCIKPFTNPWVWVLAVPVFAIVRNLPWYPFYLLAPVS